MPLFYSKELFILLRRVYYSLAVWRFKPILSAGLRFHSHLSGGLWLKNYRGVAGNNKIGVVRIFVAVIQTELRDNTPSPKNLYFYNSL